MYKHILVPTDGSAISARAERTAIALAKQLGCRLTAVHVVAPYSPRVLGEIRALGPAPLAAEEYVLLAEKRGKAALGKVVARARRARLHADAVLVTSSEPGEALARAAKESGCDLIVMGSSSRVGIERIFLGSVASDVLTGTKTPALICH